MELAAPLVKKLTLELGGKSHNLVLDDANLESAVRGALFGTFFHGGQVCESGTRLFVHEKIHDAFVERLLQVVREIRVGDPLDFASTMGPLISAKQLANTERYVAAGRQAGAKLAFGGKRPSGKGYFHEPTVFIDVDNHMPIARDEIFGPVLSVLKFSTDEEALRLANDSIYGLGAAVWSADLDRARALAGEIQAGTVWINDYHLINVRFPFGGYKQSGFGRELGPWGLAEFQQLKHIHVGQPSGPEEKPYFSLIFE